MRLFTAIVCFAVFAAGAIAQQRVMLHQINGKTISLSELSGQHITVIYFVAPDCPLCQSYSLTIRQLSETYKGRGITMLGVIAGTDYSDMEIVTFKKKYSIPFTLFKDPDFSVVKHFEATITPEVVVLDAQGKVVYQGRIDNWAYELGKKRKVITEHNLIDALESILKGETVKVPRTKAVGCFIE
jgi:peroxiredoxin